jgi:integration host factor subunit beta
VTRAELIDELSSAGQVSHKQSEVIVEAILDAMKAALQAGERIEIRGFGVFSMRTRRARRARNPRTGEALVSAERAAPHFKPGKEIKQALASRTADAR